MFDESSGPNSELKTSPLPPEVANLVPVTEFRDQRLSVQYGLGGIAGIGVVATIGCFKLAGDAPVYFTLAIAAAALTLVALTVVYFRFGKPIVLRQMHDGLTLISGSDEYWIPFERLTGFTARWTDVFRNNVYSHTQVRLEFQAENAELSVMKFDASATYGTPKYDDLQEFQMHVAGVVADRMAETLLAEGRVDWTARLALLPDGLEYTKSSTAEPTILEYARISRWQIDQGLFKLAVDGQKRPLLTEKTGQVNFYPGLLLFEHFKAAAVAKATHSAETPVLVG